MENIALAVERMADLYPDKTALVEWDVAGRESRINFSEFGKRCKALSRALDSAGVRPGERVLLLIPMGSALYVSILAVIRLGAVCVFVDPYMGRRRFDACCAAVKPKAFIGIPKGHVFRLLCPNLRRVPIAISTHGLPGWIAGDLSRLIAANLSNDNKASPPVSVSPDDPALISFTTGSSGDPKGSNRTHAFLQGQLEALDIPLKRECSSDFPGFPVLPLENLARGRTTFIPGMTLGKVREAGGGRVLRQLNLWRPEMMSGSPAYLESVADAALASGQTFDSLRALYTGGAPITVKALEKLRKVWPLAAIAVVYGSTEAEPVSSISVEEAMGECRARSRSGWGFCVGQLVERLQVCILPLEFRASEADSLEPFSLAAGQIGEIAVCGPHVNTTYWNNPAGERANKIRTPSGIWHRMGDAGYFDAQGRLWVVGRVHMAMANPHFQKESARGTQNKISDAGEWPWLFPYQVECIIDEFPAVRKSAYFEFGNRFWLVVETRDRKGPKALETELRAALSGFPLDGIRFHPRLPVDPRHNSKVEYATLRNWLERNPGA